MRGRRPFTSATSGPPSISNMSGASPSSPRIGPVWLNTASSRDDARSDLYCHPSDVLQDVLSIMKERGFVHIPIIDQDKHELSVRHTEDEVNGVTKPIL